MTSLWRRLIHGASIDGNTLYSRRANSIRKEHTPMNAPVVVIGIGEMGAVFARGFLRAGYPVYPVTRHSDLAEAARAVPSPELVLVAVAENDLHSVLEQLPPAWFQRIGLLQNELLPGDWEQYGFAQPTVISVWFEKKKGQDVKVLIPSPAFGPQAGLLQEALGSIDIPVRQCNRADELLFELVVKNVYIVTTNCAGLVTGGTVSELWEQHRELAEAVAREVIRIQESLTGKVFDADALIQGMLGAFDGDPAHKCTGRSAPARLARAIRQADVAGLDIPRLREIAASQGPA
jgi:ketopantoate reductase